MNAEHDADVSREREWRLQEQARLDQQCGRAPDGSARALRYRLIARELDKPLDAALPSNFAYAQSQRIERIAEERRRADARFARRLRWGFGIGYGMCMLAAAAVFAPQLLDAVDPASALRGKAGPWLPAVLGCMALGYALSSRPWRWFASRRG